MNKAFLILGLAVAFASQAADYTLDFSGATHVASEAPVLRKAEMPLAVGQIPSIAVGDTITMQLFEDVAFLLDVVSAPPAGIAGQSFIAKDANGSASAIVKVNEKTARISVDDFMNRRQYTVRCKDGKVLIVERDNSQVDEGECGTCGGEIEVPQTAVEETTAASTKKTRTLLGASDNEFPLAEQKSVVDILVAFDQGAVARSPALGYETIEDFADYAVGKMNTVLANSKLDDQFCYRLVGVTEIDDSWTAIDNTLLNNVRVRAGKLAKLGQLREKYGADTITLLIDRTNGTTSGIGYEYASKYTDTSGFDGMNYACNVCDINTVYSRYTMSHETGHNMGCGHSNRQGSDSGPGRYSYSCGYHFTDANNVKRGTVMAYTYSGDNDGWYDPTPYFSTPDISPSEYGCALGKAGVNDNRQTLKNTHADIASLREHVLPYDWDVKFLDDNGNEIKDGNYFSSSINVTLAHNDSNATIYYTTDGTEPDGNSNTCKPGDKIYLSTFYDGVEKKISACAVVNGQAVSTRSITLTSGIYWSGEEGENGSGRWIANDSGIKAWCNSSSYVLDSDKVAFLDLPGVDAATVTVKGQVSPASAVLFANSTEYKFVKGDDNAVIKLHDEAFEPAGDWNFNVPLSLDAKTFKVSAHRLVEFHEPFGTNILAGTTFGYCTNNISLGNFGTLIVSPGQGKTQKFDKFDTQNYYSSSRIIFGEGNIIINGPYDTDKGVFGNVQVIVGSGANLLFACAAATGYNMTSSFTVEKGATVTFDGEMEHMQRALYLAGATLICNNRFDKMNAYGTYVTDDSEIAGSGYLLLRRTNQNRNANETVNVASEKTLTLNIGTQDGSNTSGIGIVKSGDGTIVANKELKHSGATIVSNGTFTVGYSSSNTYGAGWKIVNGAKLKVAAGESLAVPSLTLESGATIAAYAAETAPLVATEAVSVDGVLFELEGTTEFNAGEAYPLLKSNASISGATEAVTTLLPELPGDLSWKLKEEDGVLYAIVAERPVAAGAVSFTANSDAFSLDVPYDATIGENGGAVIDASPIVVNGLSTKKVSMAVKFVVPDTLPSDVATICSWRLGDYEIYCVRETTGKLNCRWINVDGSLKTTANTVTALDLTPGEHLVQVGYYSYTDNSNSSKNGGTKVLLDGTVAYFANGLKFSSENVSKVTFGATAEDSPRFPYPGLEIVGAAVMDLTKTTPTDRMTSNATITYAYDKASGIPRIFPGETGGGLGMDESVVEAAFSETPSEATVSVLASFPADSVGVICGMWVQITSTTKCGAQAEYEGDGKLYIRSNDDGLTSWAATRLAEANTDVTMPHLYTLTYKDGEGVTFYQDGVALLRATSPYLNYTGTTIVSPMTFGCSTYNTWSGTTFHDYPNPAKNLHIYASHIALGTSDRTESEGPVMRAMGTLPIVDVLVAYDNGAQAYVANKGVTLEEFAETQIGKMNEVLITNKLNNCYSYRLAGVCKVAETYGTIDDVTSKLVSGEGALVSLRAARELYGADTVTLLVNTSGATLGDSIPLSSPTDVANQHECAFSVCSIRAVDTGKQHTMIHENAHNMGCGHADAQAPRINSPFEYGRGYYFQDGEASLHTIMAYGGDNDASWYFSTSSSQFGLTLGDATHDNARVLRETCSEVAKWRDGSAISLEGVEIPGVALETSARFPWYVDNEGLVRSYNRTEYDGNQCTTPLKATIEGPKMLSFKHKSYFGGETIGGSNYSHFDVLLDDAPVLTQTECLNDWTEAKLIIPEGTHEVTFVFSQRFAMNNSKDYKDGTPEADDAVWLKDIAIGEIPDVELANKTSTSEDVSWEMPSALEAKELADGGIEVLTKGIVETLNFNTNVVVLSVLAELPEEQAGKIVTIQLSRESDNGTFYAYAYSKGNGKFSLGHGESTESVTSDIVSNWTSLHVWTIAFNSTEGIKLYCDGVEIAASDGIKWNGSLISGPLTFGFAGMKIYAVHSEFGPDAWTRTISPIVEGAALKISEIMPKPTDAQNRGALEGMDVNGLESGWVEVENTSAKWVDLKDYKFTRTNRGKKSNQADYGNFPSRLIPPYGRAIFYTSERYSNSKSKEDSAFAEGTFDGKPMIFEDYGNILVWGDKVNPKKSPFVRLYYAPNDTIESVVDTVVIPSDLPEGWSIIVGQAEEDEGTRRWMCPTPTRNAANSNTDDLTRIGPNVGPLYEKKGQKKTDLANEFASTVPPAKPGEDYIITLPINPVMNPAGVLTTKETPTPRTADMIQTVKFVYRKNLDDKTLVTNTIGMATKTIDENWGDQYTATIPSDYFPDAGHLMQWKVLITDGEGVEWTSPSFNNKDDGYEWYGTIVEPSDDQLSANLPTWHMFASGNHLSQMDVDKDKQNLDLVPNYARIAIYDSSTSNYYDYVRIDLRGNTSAKFTKKSHGLRFAKAHPLTMRDIVSGEDIKEIRKTSLISEFADPSYMRQMIAFWLWRKMGNLVPFDFPVRCNLNGEFYQLAFNSERFTDELVEDVYGLDKYGYSYKNVGTLKSGSGTTAGGIEKKTPDDEDESNTTVLESELRSKIIAAQDKDVENHAELTKFVVQKFDLPAWINYLASARITQEMDDVWANVCAYYDNPDMKEGNRGTGTWMPLGYDFNLSFGQYYIGDLVSGALNGLSATNDWYKSHPLYGGWTICARKSDGGKEMDGNNGFEAVYQSPKFRRLYLRRLRTLMDQELKAPGTLEGATPFMFEMRKLANLMRIDAAEDNRKWGNNTSDDAIDVWKNITRPASMDDGIDDIWENYVVPRRQHLYVTHSITNTSWAVGYAADRNAGIPEAQSSFEALAANITVDYSNLDHGVIVISNRNDEVVDMSGWTLDTGAKKVYTLPAGTVCDSNDCIYVVSDRRQYIAEHASDLTDQVIIGNATFGSDIPEDPLSYPEVETSSGTVSISEEPVVFTAKTEDEAVAWVESLTPELTAEQIKDGLTSDKFTVVAKEVPGEPGKYQAVVDLNPVTVEKPEVDTSLEEPVEIEEDTEDPDKKKVSVSISNAIQGLWYGYEVSDALGENAVFTNDVDSFERATGSAHKVKGSPRDKSKTSGFFRLKVLPAKPSKTSE